jgi:transposase
MTDAEWVSLSECLRRGAARRPARDARRSWDGIFWIACSKGPWRALPAGFGRPDSVHRVLRRAALAHLLHRVLLRVADHPLLLSDPLRGIAWFVERAFRRAFRVAPGAIAYARLLGLTAALPAATCWLPKPDLSEAVIVMMRKLSEPGMARPLPLLRAIHWLFQSGLGHIRHWRTTE